MEYAGAIKFYDLARTTLVRDWVAGDAQDARFWRAYWPNLRMDIEAICVHSRVELPWGRDVPGDVPASLEAAQAQADLALSLSRRLVSHPLFVSSERPSLHRLQWAVGKFEDQQCDLVALDESLDDLLHLIDRVEFKGLIFDVIRRLMLHPSWDLTESGASLVANLIKKQSKQKGRTGGPWWLIEDLLKSDPKFWRLLYGAVDAAYNVGGVDGYGMFRKALIAVKHVDQCRVRGICADNLRMWVKRASDEQKRQILEASLEFRVGGFRGV